MPATERAIEMAQTAAQAAADKKAEGVIILDVADQLVITDAFLLASAPNERQVLAISDAIQESLLALPEKEQRAIRQANRKELMAVASHRHIAYDEMWKRSRRAGVWLYSPPRKTANRRRLEHGCTRTLN